MKQLNLPFLLSSLQSVVHPSLLLKFPSSHYSPSYGSKMPSPQELPKLQTDNSNAHGG